MDNESTRAFMATIDRLVAERDAAEQMVAEMRAALTTGRDIVIETSSRHTRWVEDAYDILEASVPIAGRWCMTAERDAVTAWADAAERRESELGLQVVAQAARLRLATAVCDALKRAEARAAQNLDGFPDYYDATAALAAWNAVPGDVSQDTVPRCRSTRCVGATLEEVERCAGAAGHRSACFGGVPPPPAGAT